MKKIVIACWYRNASILPYTLKALTKHVPQYRTEVVMAGENEPWCTSIRRFCRVTSEPFLLMLEDYITVDADAQLLEMAWDRAKDYGCVRLLPCPGSEDTAAEFGPIHPEERYSVSLQASIWQPDALLSVTEDGKTAWDAEIGGMRRYAANPTYRTVCTNRNAISYDNAMRGLKILPDVLAKAEAML